MRVLELVQRSPEWHAYRRAHIMASDSPVICRVSKWSTPYKLWLEKLGLGEEKIINPAMQQGIDLEDEARNLLNSSNREYSFESAVIESAVNPLFAASLDGIMKKEKVICEIKCPSSEKGFQYAKQGMIPDNYMMQMQHQLLVTEYDLCLYCVYFNSELCTIEVKPDKAAQEMIIEQGKKFWKHVEDFIAPELTEHDLVHRNDEQWKEFAIEWSNVCNQEKLILEQKENLRKRAVELTSNQNTEGSGVRVSHCYRKGSVDYDKIDALKKVDLEQYRKSPIKYVRIC